jgi:hypothetical protein
VEDRAQPAAQPLHLPETVALAQSALDAVLDKIVRLGRVARQSTRVSPQPWQLRNKSLTELSPPVHRYPFGLYLASEAFLGSSLGWPGKILCPANLAGTRYGTAAVSRLFPWQDVRSAWEHLPELKRLRNPLPCNQSLDFLHYSRFSALLQTSVFATPSTAW